ncbi:hypothetical protein YC2023_072707 [Brassica napus]
MPLILALGRVLRSSSYWRIGWKLWRRRWESPTEGVHLMIINLQPLQIHQNLLTNPGLVPKPLPKLQRRESLGNVLGRVRTDSESVNGAKAGQKEAKEPSLTTEPSSSRELCLVSPADDLPSDDPSLLILDKQVSTASDLLVEEARRQTKKETALDLRGLTRISEKSPGRLTIKSSGGRLNYKSLQISKSIAKITSALTRRLPGKSSTARRLKAYIRLLQAHRITNESHPPIIVSFYDFMNHKNFRIKILGFFSSLWRESERYVVFSSQEWKKKKGKSILGALRASNWLFMVVVVLMTMAIL